MKGRSLIVAIIIVVGALASFLIWKKGNDQQFDVEYFGFFKKQEQQLIIQYGQQLLWLSSDGHLQKKFDVNRTPLIAHGDYDFFSNGDLLIYHKSKPLSFIEGIKQYLRLTKPMVINPVRKMGDDGFYRCQLTNHRCSLFGLDLPLLDRSFRLVIDKQSDSVYLSDTSSHRLYKISEQGIILASSKNQFIYPNQLSLIGSVLWVADTNHHRLISVASSNHNFAQVLNEFSISPSLTHQWPHQFSYQTNHFWVNVADKSMSDGILVQYDLTGKQINRANSKYLIDPTTMIIWQNKLLVTDFQSALIEQFSLQGDSLGLFQVTQLTDLLKAREEQIRQGKLFSLIGMTTFVITLIIGLIGAWFLERKESLALFVSADYGPTDKMITEARVAFKGTSSSIVWLDNQLMRNKQKYIYNLTMIIMLIFTVLLTWFYVLFSLLNTIITAIVLLMFVISYHYTIHYIRSIKLGVQGNKLITVVNGKTTVADFSSVFYNALYLYTDEQSIPLGNKKQAIFSNVQLKEFIYPQLQPENKLSGLTLVKHLWRQKEPLFLGYTILLLVVVVMTFWEMLA